MLKTIQQHIGAVIDPSTQKRLNDPLASDQALQREHKNFLKTLLEKLEKGEISVHAPSSLFNHAVYDKLSEGDQEKTGITALNLLNVIRQIEMLYQLEKRETFQIQNLVETVWQMKSKYEKEHGDVFII